MGLTEVPAGTGRRGAAIGRAVEAGQTGVFQAVPRALGAVVTLGAVGAEQTFRVVPVRAPRADQARCRNVHPQPGVGQGHVAHRAELRVCAHRLAVTSVVTQEGVGPGGVWTVVPGWAYQRIPSQLRAEVTRSTFLWDR